MSVFVISDVHLSLSSLVEKPMDIFGEEWTNHAEKLKINWESVVGSQDTVLVAGDISWALRLPEAMADLEFLHSLPGRKVFIKGNHDLWWTGIGKLNKLFDSSMTFLQNNATEVDGISVCGTRGWICPGIDGFDEHDQKIYNREIIRLRMSLESARNQGHEDIIAMLHYPPTNDKLEPSGFTELFKEYGVRDVVYGHLHGKDAFRRGLKGQVFGANYHLTSFDYLGGKLLKLR